MVRNGRKKRRLRVARPEMRVRCIVCGTLVSIPPFMQRRNHKLDVLPWLPPGMKPDFSGPKLLLTRADFSAVIEETKDKLHSALERISGVAWSNELTVMDREFEAWRKGYFGQPLFDMPRQGSSAPNHSVVDASAREPMTSLKSLEKGEASDGA